MNSTNWVGLISEDDKRRVLSRVKSSLLGIKKIIHSQFSVFTSKHRLIELKLSAGLTNYKGRSSLVGYIIEKQKKEPQENVMWLNNITDTDLIKIIDILELNQNLLSDESKEKLKKIYKKTFDSGDINNEDKLTDRELEVLDLFCKGKTKHEIGEKLFLSVRTVERHRARLIEKTKTWRAIPPKVSFKPLFNCKKPSAEV